MNDLSIHVHNKQFVSVKDHHEINISESKWNFIFEFLLKNGQVVYFLGHRYNYMDDEFEKTVFYLREEVLWSVDDPPIHLFFRVKDAAFLSNRNLLAKMWSYYEFPVLIFSNQKSKQDLLTAMIENRDYPEQIMSSIDGLIMVFPPHSFSDFLYIRTSADMPNLFFFKNL
ncbi:MAG: hypothetical protein JWQ79_267 [Mucilaginibacter sp.]|jgi:hypothetical protein|nr:hypothetical protein [Mucilaginibacter sp.]